MKRALFLICAASSIVSAAGTHLIAPPDWKPAEDQARELSAKANGVAHFGGVTSLATAEAFVAPEGPGTLLVTTVVAKISDHRDAAVSAELDSFQGAPKRAQFTSAKIQIEQSEYKLDPATKQLVATQSWRDDDAGTRMFARLVIAGDQQSLVAVIGEYITTDKTPIKNLQQAHAALDTLDPGIPADRRVDLALAPPGSDPPPLTSPSGAAAPTMSGTAPEATMSDGRRTPMPPIVVSSTPRRTVDRRPVYVGLGIIVLAALFWWNRRRRERLEATDSKDNDGR